MPHLSMAREASDAPPTALPRHHAPELAPYRSRLSSEDLIAQYDTDFKSVLGRGAHGVVLRTTHKPTQTQYAMKTCRKAEVPPHSLYCNRQEGKFLTSVLRHENIVQAIEYFETNDTVALVLELAEDGDLLDVVNKRLGVSELEASLIALQLINGLSYSHSLGIVHGDVKLENILVLKASPEQQRRFGTEQRFALCSWGFAHKHICGEVSERKYGTLRYQAPERFTIRDCAPAIDIWALGVVIYGMVCAALPFDGKSASEIAEKIKAARFSFPDKVSPEFRALVSAMLQVDPLARPSLYAIREFAWFAPAKNYLRRLSAAPLSPTSSPKLSRTPKSESRSNSGGSLSVSSTAPIATSVPSNSPPSSPTPKRTLSASPPVPTPFAASTPATLPPLEICTSPPPKASPIASMPKPTSACWYLPDD